MTDAESERFVVVVNDEEQYSIWSAGREAPRGWRTIGFEGERQACLDHIDAVWTDMRPASLRRAVDGGEPAQP